MWNIGAYHKIRLLISYFYRNIQLVNMSSFKKESCEFPGFKSSTTKLFSVEYYEN